jgi:hypothetical protein
LSTDPARASATGRRERGIWRRRRRRRRIMRARGMCAQQEH